MKGNRRVLEYLIMEKLPVPQSVSQVTHTLENAGFEAYLVGGCVRDLFLGKTPKDWDVTTNAKPDEIIALFPKTFYENDYGTVGVVNEEETDTSLKIIEVTPYRTEGKYSDGRRPDTVSFDATLEDDLKRRDFTINAIAYNETKNVVVDPFFGKSDIQKGIIRAVGNPEERFHEDALRLLRAIRIHSEIGFSIEDETKEGMKKSSHLLKHIAKERVRDEFVRMIMSDRPMNAILACEEYGVLVYIAPELEATIGIEQNQAHSYDVWIHILKSLQHAADKKAPLHIRLTALFHDISKPETRRHSKDKEKWTFYGHEVVGARKTQTILNNLKFPKELIDTVVKLVRWHMFFSDTEQITLSAVRRLITNVGRENVWDLMEVRVCDRIGTGRPKENPYRLRKYRAMIEEALHDPVSVGMLAINGEDLIHMEIPVGPKIGFILHALLEEVLEDPTLNTKEVLTKRASELANLSIEELKKRGDSGKEKREVEEEKILKKIRSRHKVQ